MKLVPKGESDVDVFEKWAMDKFSEIENRINPCNEDGSLDPVRLNYVLTTFSSHFAWCITIQEVEVNKLNIMNHEYEIWYKKKYNFAVRAIQTEMTGGRFPAQHTIEARIVDMASDEILKKKKEIQSQNSKVEILKGLVKVFDKQAGILQTLSSNMRSELFLSGGLSVKSNGTSNANEMYKNMMKQKQV